MDVLRMDAIERSAGDAMLQRDPPQVVAMMCRTLSVGGVSSIAMPYLSALRARAPASDRRVRRAADPSPARDRFGCRSSGRRRFQRPSQHVAERLGRPAAKALDVAGHNVECTRSEARLDADDGIDAPYRQTRLRQSGAQLLFRGDTEHKRPASDFGGQGPRVPHPTG